MKHTILIPWQSQNNVWWNDVCAQVVEHFGLPGDRYTTEVSSECMKFFFDNELDAFMCKIMVSEKI